MNLLRRVLPLVAIVACSACLTVARRATGGAAQDHPDPEHNWQILSSEGKPLSRYPLTIVGTGVPPHSPGQKCYVAMLLWNRGDRTVHIPVSPLVTPVSNLRLTARLEGGGEEVTYGHGPVGRDYLAGDSILIAIPPHNSHALCTWFIPWVAGTYECTLTLRNTAETTRQDRAVPVTVRSAGKPVQLPMYRSVDVRIPDVWVGECSLRSLIATQADTVADGEAVEEDGWCFDVFDLKKRLDELRATIATASPSTLGDAAAAIETLVEMRHVFAVETLVSLEHEMRPAPPRREGEVPAENPLRRVVHSQIVGALHRLARHGAGYLALATFEAVAKDRNVGVSDRVLCISVLKSFLGKEITHRGRTIHVITAEEQSLARRAIEALRADAEGEPEAIQRVLQ